MTSASDLVGHVAGRAAGDVDHVDAGELAHPGQLAAGVVAGAALHRLDVAGQQLLEAQRLAGRRRRAGGVGARGPRPRPRRPASRRPARRSARRAPRAPSPARPAASGGAWRRSTARTRRWAARARRCRAAPARGRSAGGRSGSISAAAHGARRARIACRACGPRRSSSAIQRSRTPSAGGGRRLSSVSAARRYRPVPPTTIGRRPGGEQLVDLGVGELGVLAGAEGGVDGQERDQPVLEPARSAALGGAGERSRARRRPGARRPTRPPDPRPASRSRSASAIATSVLPTPVGPNSAITSAAAIGGSIVQRCGARVAIAWCSGAMSVTGRRRDLDRRPTRWRGATEAARAAADGARTGAPPTWRWCSPAAPTWPRPRRRSRASTRRWRPGRWSAAAPAACCGAGRELESGTAVAVWAASLDGGAGAAVPRHVIGEDDDGRVLEGMPEPSGDAA